MNSKVLRVLEYNKIIDRLTDKATSEQGRKLTSALLPMTDPEAIRTAQTQTSDIFFVKDPPPLAATRILACASNPWK